MGRGTVRLATAADHDAIHALNYRTFVEEIPQHEPNAHQRLVDRFHDDNVYAVYEVNGAVVGMVSGRTQRPFSLDQKLGGVDGYLPAGRTPVEIRLLAVEPAYRAGRVFSQLVAFITRHFMASGFDLGIMSGTTRQLRLYRQLGDLSRGIVGRIRAGPRVSASFKSWAHPMTWNGSKNRSVAHQQLRSARAKQVGGHT